mmetsp:Transcript_59666/g.193263  ORF Transcript_59666/g.193263 Transcript_59666/m.193263 type:complete len:226 (-) Transcript_59666:212-889(-)
MHDLTQGVGPELHTLAHDFVEPIATSLVVNAGPRQALHRPQPERCEPIDVRVVEGSARPDTPILHSGAGKGEHLHAGGFALLLEPCEELAEGAVEVAPRQGAVHLWNQERGALAVRRCVGQACQLFRNRIAVHPKNTLQLSGHVGRRGDDVVCEHGLAYRLGALGSRPQGAVPRHAPDFHLLHPVQQRLRHWRMRRNRCAIEGPSERRCLQHATQRGKPADFAEE